MKSIAIVFLLWINAGLLCGAVRVAGEQLAASQRAAADREHAEQLEAFDAWQKRIAEHD